jgi:hypothetical protein
MGSTTNVHKILMKLHFLHRVTCDSLLFRVTLDRLQEGAVLGLIYGILCNAFLFREESQLCM